MNSTVARGPPFSAQQTLVLHALNFTFSGMSLLGSSLIVLSYVLFPSLRKFYHRLIFLMSVADIVSSSTVFFVMALALGHGPLLKDGSWCSLMGFTLTMSVVSVDCYILVATVHVYCKTAHISNVTTLSQKTWVESHAKLCLLLVQTFSFLTALAPLLIPGFGYHALSGGVYCFIDKPKWTRYLIGTGPRYIIMTLIMVLYSKLYLSKKKELTARLQTKEVEKEQNENTFSLSTSSHTGNEQELDYPETSRVRRKSDRPSEESKEVKSPSELQSEPRAQNEIRIPLSVESRTPSENNGSENKSEASRNSESKKRRPSKKSKKRGRKISEEEKGARILLRMMVFVPLIYFAVWLLPTVNAIYEVLPNAKVSYIFILFRLTWPWQGFWNALLWSYVERLPDRFRQNYWPQGFKTFIRENFSRRAPVENELQERKEKPPSTKGPTLRFPPKLRPFRSNQVTDRTPDDLEEEKSNV